MRITALFLMGPTVLLTIGCDVFLPDYGAEHMPCRGGDCQDGLRCVQQFCVSVHEGSGQRVSQPGAGRIQSIALSHVGDQGVLVATSSTSVDGVYVVPKLWEIDAGYFKDLAEGHTSRVTSLAFLRDSYKILAADEQGIRLWEGVVNAPVMSDAITGRDLVAGFQDGSWFVVGDTQTGAFDILNGAGDKTTTGNPNHGDRILAAAFSPAGKPVSFVTAGRGIRKWKCRDDGCTGVDSVGSVQLAETEIGPASYRSDAYVVAAVLPSWEEVKIWNPESDSEWDLVTYLETDKSPYRALSFSPRDRWLLAIGREDGAVEIWNCGNTEYIFLDRVFHDLESRVEDVAFSPDGRYLAASGTEEFVTYDVNQVIPTQE